jgi:hypothetical protein
MPQSKIKRKRAMLSRTSYLTLQKITELAEKGKKESADDESLATTIPTAPIPPPRKRPPMTDPTELYRVGSESIKCFISHQEKKDTASKNCGVCSNT